MLAEEIQGVQHLVGSSQDTGFVMFVPDEASLSVGGKIAGILERAGYQLGMDYIVMELKLLLGAYH